MPTETRTHIYTSHRAEDALEELNRIDKLARDFFKREYVMELYFSSQGFPPKARYGITVYHDDTKPEQLEFLKNAVSEP